MTPRPSLGFVPFGMTTGTAPLIVALGDREHSVDAWLQPLRGDFSFLSLEAPRTADPRRFGVPTRSGDWYLADERGPEPCSFGLALIALERFVLDARRRSPEPPFLLGVGQGATLCLALARCWAEALAGVIAIDGGLAELPQGAIEEVPLSGLPILVVDGSVHGRPGAAQRLPAQLSDRGGCVTLACEADALPITSWLANVAGSREGLEA